MMELLIQQVGTLRERGHSSPGEQCDNENVVTIHQKKASRDDYSGLQSELDKTRNKFTALQKEFLQYK